MSIKFDTEPIVRKIEAFKIFEKFANLNWYTETT